MMAQRNWLEIALMIIVGVALPFAMGLALTAAERRGWIGHGVGKESANVAFAAMEGIFSASVSQARQVLQEQKRVGHSASTPGGLARRRAVGHGPVRWQTDRLREWIAER